MGNTVIHFPSPHNDIIPWTLRVCAARQETVSRAPEMGTRPRINASISSNWKERCLLGSAGDAAEAPSSYGAETVCHYLPSVFMNAYSHVGHYFVFLFQINNKKWRKKNCQIVRCVTAANVGEPQRWGLTSLRSVECSSAASRRTQHYSQGVIGWRADDTLLCVCVCIHEYSSISPLTAHMRCSFCHCKL